MPKKRIMVVEDEKDIQDILCSILGGEGYEVFSARNGEEALKRLQEIDPHLILLDMNMPKMGGVSFYHKIYDPAQEKSQYPVLFLTGRAEMEKLFRDLHVDGFLSKPFQVDELLREVRRILDRRFGPELSKGEAAKSSDGPPKILVVDGETASFEKIAVSFLNAGYTVNAASSAAKALEKITSGEGTDLVLIRLNLPDMPGDMLAYRLKLVCGEGSVPMLLYTAELSTFDRQLTREICQRAGIREPVESQDPEILLRECEQLLKGRRSAA